MDAYLLRPKQQMSYAQQQQQQQQLANNQRANRSHYSNRQQLQQQQHHHHHHHHHQQQHLQQQQHHHQQQQALKAHQQPLGSSSSSEAEEQVQLNSSLSTSGTSKTSSSQQTMLAHNKQLGQHQQHHGQHQAAMHRQRSQTSGLAGPQQRAGLQQQSGKLVGASFGSNKVGSSVDNMTSSSSSDHTLDDLHQLAHGYGRHLHQHQHRLAAGRLAGDQADLHQGGRFLLGVLFTVAELLLFGTLFLWLYWSYQHDDGLSWQNERKQQFNTHAALMLFGFVFLNGQAMLVYRSFQCCSKIYTKILHTILFVLATSAISLGLILGYTAQENVGVASKPIMHFYSLHAWSGLCTVVLFVFQFVFGFLSFLILLCCDQATSNFRQALLPIHKTFGLIIFSLAIATCLTGLLQTARSRLSTKLNKVDYHELSEAGIVVNMIGVCLICLAILMPYIIRNLNIKRAARSDIERQLKLELRI